VLKVRALSDALGGEVIGVDLRKPLEPSVVREIRDAWLQYQVLVFRGQDIDSDDQRRLVGCFGELQAPRSKIKRVNPDILYVANVSVDGDQGQLPDGDMQFHADQCYYEEPTRGAVLYGMEVPSKGGNTLFANMYRAYETLPPALRSRLARLEVLFVYDYEKSGNRRGPVAPDAPRFVHPAVIVHPETKRAVLFVNRLMADSFVGMPRGESDELLERLFEHIERPDMAYEHSWRRGDVVVWDNFCTLHARTDFNPAERRVLRRMAIGGGRPIAFRQEAPTAE
jgi:taurine dioxygenase